jgi:hypothetical protein
MGKRDAHGYWQQWKKRSYQKERGHYGRKGKRRNVDDVIADINLMIAGRHFMS